MRKKQTFFRPMPTPIDKAYDTAAKQLGELITDAHDPQMVIQLSDAIGRLMSIKGLTSVRYTSEEVT